MAKVTNLTPRHLEVLRWTILPMGSRLINPARQMVDTMPDELAYSDNLKRLADEGVLEIEGYVPEAKRPAPPAPKTEPVKPATKKPRAKDVD